MVIAWRRGCRKIKGVILSTPIAVVIEPNRVRHRQLTSLESPLTKKRVSVLTCDDSAQSGFVGPNKAESAGISEDVAASANCYSQYEDDLAIPSLLGREL